MGKSESQPSGMEMDMVDALKRMQAGEFLRAEKRRIDREYWELTLTPCKVEEISALREKRYQLAADIAEIEKIADEFVGRMDASQRISIDGR